MRIHIINENTKESSPGAMGLPGSKSQWQHLLNAVILGSGFLHKGK
jgi:hypothetical protein